MSSLKLVVMGTGPFAVPSFQALIRSAHEIDCLVTRPDKRSRGRTQPQNPMRDLAQASDIPVFAPESINSPAAIAHLARAAADLFVVCDYGQILSREALAQARGGGINLHASLLPKYRGAAPVNWALLAGDAVTGVSVIHMTPRLDGGPILRQRSLEIAAAEDAEQLEQRLATLGVQAVLESIELVSGWDGETRLGELQDPQLVSKAPRLKKSDGAVDWSKPATQILNQVRALKPWPGTFTHLLREGKPPLRVILEQVRAGVVQLEPSLAAGTARTDAQGRIHVQCGEGALTVDRLRPSGKREMESSEFVRGYGTSFMLGDSDH